jgi:hypothetical protein
MTDENAAWAFFAVRSEEGFPLLLSEDMAAALWKITPDIRWLTTWAHTEDRANPEIGARLGWPVLPTPMIGYPRRFGDGSMWLKSRVVQDELTKPGPPVIWIDDNCEEMLAPAIWGGEFTDPHNRLIWIAPSPDLGITKSVLDFVRTELLHSEAIASRHRV